jgi:hypothetical protein
MSLANWIYWTTTGWWIWVAVVGALCSYLVWVRTTRPRQAFVPLVLLALWLAGSIAYFVYTHWYHYFGRLTLWLSGVASILLVAVVPLAVTLLVERTASPLIRHHLVRITLAGGAGVLVTLCVQRPLALWIQHLAVHLAS